MTDRGNKAVTGGWPPTGWSKHEHNHDGRSPPRVGGAPPRLSYRHALQFIRLFWLTAWTTSQVCRAVWRPSTTNSRCSSYLRAARTVATPGPSSVRSVDIVVTARCLDESALSDWHCL